MGVLSVLEGNAVLLQAASQPTVQPARAYIVWISVCFLWEVAWKHNKPILHISPVTALRAMRLASSTFPARPIIVIVLGAFLALALMDTLHPVAVWIRSA